MPEKPDNQTNSNKTPQQELEELLRQARPAGPARVGLPGLAKSSTASRPMGRAGARGFQVPGGRAIGAIGLAILALVLVVGTGAFLISLFTSNTGQIVLELGQEDISLTVDDESRGTVDSGNVLRVRPGEHTLTFAKEGFLSAEQEVSVERGQSVSILMTLLPIPTIEKVLDEAVVYPRLSNDGSEVSYFDPAGNVFKTVSTTSKQVAELFRGDFPAIANVAWSRAGWTVLAQLNGVYTLSNMIDNRNVLGGYVLLGERPSQGPANRNGVATWLFDDSRQLAATGWQPILLNESIRQVAFAPDGEGIVYIYEPTDGEYSLVRALPDGREWERIIVDLPRFTNPQMTWSADDRYLLIEDEGRLWLADLIDRSLSEPFVDWTPGSRFEISNEGDKVVYAAGNELRIYDLSLKEMITVPELSASGDMVFTWLDANTLVVAMANQTFVKVDIETGQQIIIPFVGTDSEIVVTDLSYSRSGQVLMIVASNGLYVMKI